MKITDSNGEIRRAWIAVEACDELVQYGRVLEGLRVRNRRD